MLWRNSLSITGVQDRHIKADVHLFFTTTNCKNCPLLLVAVSHKLKIQCLSAYWRYKSPNKRARICAVIEKMSIDWFTLNQSEILARTCQGGEGYHQNALHLFEEFLVLLVSFLVHTHQPVKFIHYFGLHLITVTKKQNETLSWEVKTTTTLHLF